MLDKEEIDNLIIKRKIGMAESTLLSMPQTVINQRLMELDLVAHRMEMKWGVGRLLELAPVELRAKWLSQVAKLEAGIIAEDVPLVEELVKGSCRGWEALEKAAVGGGHVPCEPQVWEVAVEGETYRVVRYQDEAVEGGVVSLPELVRVFHGRRQAVFSAPADVVADLGVKKKFYEDKEIGF